MRDKLILMMLLGLALAAGCSFSAGISRGQELESDLMPSVVVDNDDFRQVYNASVRIRAYNNDTLQWMGSGLVYKVEDNRVFCLSNQHVCGEADKITAEFFRDGRSLGEFKMRVDLCKQSNDGIDVGVISCNIGKTLKGIEPIEFSTKPVKMDDELFFVGSARGEWPQGRLGRVVGLTDKHIYSNPTSIPGDSGSSLIRFNEDGEGEIVGLIAWYSHFEGVRVCMAMKNEVVLDVLAGGEVPDLGDAPPIAEGTERLIQGLLERIRELREDNRRERKGLLERIEQLQYERAVEEQEAQIFRDRWWKWQKDNDKHLDDIEDNQDSIVEGLSRKFDNLKTLLKWSSYGLIALLVAALFFKQGWATTVIVCIITFVFRTGKLAYLLVHRAIVSKVKNPKSITEALDDLTDGISEGIGRKDDPPS
jgi:hypothetical protein